MRIPLLLVLAAIPAAAQNPLVQMRNASNPASREFLVGDRFEILITGAPNQPISVRTSTQGRTDWSPVIASTDGTGRWSTGGQFEKSDFGSWNEIWTVGGKLASPAVQFRVMAPCLPGGQQWLFSSGLNEALVCDTAEGSQKYVTPSFYDPFRTPDGRLAPSRPAEQTARQYRTGVIEDFITSGKQNGGVANHSAFIARWGLGDETADLITELIGVNALREDETRNVLAVIRAAFERLDNIQPSGREPSRTLLLLRHLADWSDQESLKQEIDKTIAYVQAR